MPGIVGPGSVPVGNVYGPVALANFAHDAGFPAPAIPVVVAIALAESGGNALATHVNGNGTTDYGVWQINSVHKAVLSQGDWKNPADNAKMAYTIYHTSGDSFTPWATFTNGTYKNHLSEGNDGAKAQASGQGNGQLPSLPNPLGAFGGIADLLGTILTHLVSVDFWKRAGVAIIGFVLLLVGLLYMLGQSKTGRAIKGAATSVATKGAV